MQLCQTSRSFSLLSHSQRLMFGEFFPNSLHMPWANWLPTVIVIKPCEAAGMSDSRHSDSLPNQECRRLRIKGSWECYKLCLILKSTYMRACKMIREFNARATRTTNITTSRTLPRSCDSSFTNEMSGTPMPCMLLMVDGTFISNKWHDLRKIVPQSCSSTSY